MRKGLLYLFVLSICLSMSYLSYGQSNKNNDVPAEVQKAFKAKYPKAANVDWDTSAEVQGAFEADFTLEKERYTAVFNPKGEWLETDMDVEQLPDAIKQVIGSQFADHEIIESEQVQSPIRSIYFRVILEKSPSERWEVQFLANGTIVQKEPLGEEDK